MNKKIDKREFNYRLEDVVGEPPKGLSYYGSGLVFLVIVLLVFLAGWVEYPETIQSEIDLTSVNPPRKMVAHFSTYIDSVHVGEGAFVEKGQTIIELRHSNKMKDLNWLQKEVLEQPLTHLIAADQLPGDKNFNGFQSAYDLFREALEKFVLKQSFSLEAIQLQSAKERMQLYKKELEQIKENINLLRRKVKINREALHSDSLLAQRGIESKNKVRELQLHDIDNGYQLSEEIIEKYQIELKIKELEKETEELQWNLKWEDKKALSELNSRFNALKASCEQWRKQFIVRSTVAGIIHFNNKNWVKGAFIEQGDEILKITPKEKGEIVAYAKIEDRGSSNVKMGQRVNIKLNNYPYKEYGILVGEVGKIVTTPSSNSYLVHVKFPRGLQTTYGKKLRYHPQMQGKADIVTRKQSLLTKVFYEIKMVFYK